MSNETGTLTGTVTVEDGSRLPGVIVTATSPALLGERTTITAEEGRYRFLGLPPGTYTATFELEGFKTAKKRASPSRAERRPHST